MAHFKTGLLYKHTLWRDVAINPIEIKEDREAYHLSFFWYNTNIVRLGNPKPLCLNLLDHFSVQKDKLEGWKVYNSKADIAFYKRKFLCTS